MAREIREDKAATAGGTSSGFPVGATVPPEALRPSLRRGGRQLVAPPVSPVFREGREELDLIRLQTVPQSFEREQPVLPKLCYEASICAFAFDWRMKCQVEAWGTMAKAVG